MKADMKNEAKQKKEKRTEKYQLQGTQPGQTDFRYAKCLGVQTAKYFEN